MQVEQGFQCPYCWEQISMLCDTDAGSQSYVEDCSVCCRPIKIEYQARDGAIVSFQASVLE